jgi:hypothetical protein
MVCAPPRAATSGSSQIPSRYACWLGCFGGSSIALWWPAFLAQQLGVLDQLEQHRGRCCPFRRQAQRSRRSHRSRPMRPRTISTRSRPTRIGTCTWTGGYTGHRYSVANCTRISATSCRRQRKIRGVRAGPRDPRRPMASRLA